MKQLYIIIFFSLACQLATHAAEKEKPADPFDYNFCGGERVYPIVGVNISTACGPRNQLALGRRGKIMWFFPGDETRKSYKGNLKLSSEQLTRLSILAEVAKVTDNQEPLPSRVMYKMGINFSGRQPKYIYAEFDKTYTPGNELLKAILSLVPETEKPYFPDCGSATTVFDPTLHRVDRLKQLRVKTVSNQKVKKYASD